MASTTPLHTSPLARVGTDRATSRLRRPPPPARGDNEDKPLPFVPLPLLAVSVAGAAPDGGNGVTLAATFAGDPTVPESRLLSTRDASGCLVGEEGDRRSRAVEGGALFAVVDDPTFADAVGVTSSVCGDAGGGKMTSWSTRHRVVHFSTYGLASFCHHVRAAHTRSRERVHARR